MTREHIAELLAHRSRLTSQPWGNKVVDAWEEPLGRADYDAALAAMRDAAKTETHITLAHIIERLRRHRRSASSEPVTPPARHCGCAAIARCPHEIEAGKRHIAEIRQTLRAGHQ